MTDLAPGAPLGPYVIEDEIGRGGFATVYRANDARFGGAVAIKVLASHLAGDDEAVEQFLAEARALRTVESESVVSVFDISGTDDGRPFMVLQYADRGTLLDRLVTGQPATNDELVHLTRFLDRALVALHEQSMVHRDVKPSNVLITSGSTELTESGGLIEPDERFLLGDLGLVKDLSSSPPVTRGSGSAAYAAPEQRAVVSRVDTRTDIYAASAVVAEAAIGRFRRPEETWDEVLTQISASGRPDLASSLGNGLDEDPARRPSDVSVWAAEIRASLGPVDAETQRLVDTAAAQRKATGRGRRRFAAVAILAAGLLLAAVIGLFALTDDEPQLATGEREPAALEAEVAAATVEREPVEPACGDPDRGVAQELSPAGVTIADVTDTTITVGWTAQDQAYSIFLDGKYFDNARKASNLYVFEELDAGAAHEVVMTAHTVPPDQGASVCATTASEAVDRLPVGATMATDLLATEVTSTSVTLSWTPALSGGRYTLYSGFLEEGKSFPQIIGAGGVAPDITSFEFTGLDSGAEVVVGLRTIVGENQSGLRWISIDLPDEVRRGSGPGS